MDHKEKLANHTTQSEEDTDSLQKYSLEPNDRCIVSSLDFMILLVDNFMLMNPLVKHFVLKLFGLWSYSIIITKLTTLILKDTAKRNEFFKAVELLRNKEFKPALDILLDLSLDIFVPSKQLQTYLRNKINLSSLQISLDNSTLNTPTIMSKL